MGAGGLGLAARSRGRLRPRAGFAQERTRRPRPSRWRVARGAHVVLRVGDGFYFLSHVPKSKATANSSPEEINIPAFQLIPKRSTFSRNGSCSGADPFTVKGSQVEFSSVEQIGDSRGKEVTFLAKIELEISRIPWF